MKESRCISSVDQQIRAESTPYPKQNIKDIFKSETRSNRENDVNKVCDSDEKLHHSEEAPNLTNIVASASSKQESVLVSCYFNFFQILSGRRKIEKRKIM